MNGKPNDNEFEVTERDIDQAWERLYAQLSRENVPDGGPPRDSREDKRTAFVGDGAAGEAAGAADAPGGSVAPAGKPSGRSAAAVAAGAVPAGESDVPAIEAEAAGEPEAGKPAASRRSRSRRARLLGRLAPVAAAVAVAALVLSGPWGQDVMAAMMNTFRVQQMASVSLDADDVKQLMQGIGSAASDAKRFDLKQYGDIEQTGGGAPQTLSLQAASAAAGRTLKTLPGADAAAVRFEPQRTIVFKLHTKPVNTLIALLGGKTTFPAAVDGQPIRLTIPGSYVMASESAGTSGKPASQKLLAQLPAPTLDVPSGVDLDRVRKAVLDLPLLPADLRSQLAAIGDWQHTLPVPNVTTPDGDTIRSVTFGGSNAALAQGDDERMLVWLADGWVYRLSGSTSDYPTDDAILAEAERLMRG